MRFALPVFLNLPFGTITRCPLPLRRRSPNPLNLPMIIALATLLCGCAATVLDPPPSDPVVAQLSARNRTELQLEVSALPSSTRVGSQFLLVLLPMKGVYLGDGGAGQVELTLRRALALAGYRVTTSLPDATAAPAARVTPKLRVTVLGLSLSAYDLLLTRRVSATLSLKGELLDAQGQPIRSTQITASEAEFARYGFAPQLERQLRSASETAIQLLLARLGLVM